MARPAEFSFRTRRKNLERFANEKFDLLVIGGGITGAGIARDAALRGLRVALFDKSDYAAGTSSKSSKLIHGGLRYLEHGEIGLVFESVSERAVQLDIAPHLVRPLAFLMPIYQETKPGLELMNIGLWIYDTLALFRSPRLHKTFRGAKAAEMEPLINNDGLTGAIEYYDAVTDDARLVLENVLAARAAGAECCSYTEVVSLERDPDGRVRAVNVRDVLTGDVWRVQGHVVVVAAGAWTDEASEQLAIDNKRKLLRRTKGVHLVFPAEKLPVRRAITLISSIDGRVFFAIPWRERTVLGTTDTDFEGSADNVHADAADAHYLCASANRYFPTSNCQPSDAIASWAGLRPLINDEVAGGESDVSREHEIFIRDDGIIIIAGGKLTTYRRMAKEVVRAAIKWLEKHDEAVLSRRKLRKPRTKTRPLPGADGLEDRTVDGLKKFARQLAEEHHLDYAAAKHLALTYGVRARVLAAMIDEHNELGLKMQPDLSYLWAEVEFAFKRDLARTLDDVLSRRIPLLLVGRDQGLDLVERVADTGATILGWDRDRREREIARYRQTVAQSRRFRTD